jgi:hypothetical protein
MKLNNKKIDKHRVEDKAIEDYSCGKIVTITFSSFPLKHITIYLVVSISDVRAYRCTDDCVCYLCVQR